MEDEISLEPIWWWWSDDSKKDIIKLRKYRGFWILTLIILICLSSITFTWLLWFWIMSFENSNIYPFFIWQSIIQIIWLAIIIVKFLFNKDSMGD